MNTTQPQSPGSLHPVVRGRTRRPTGVFKVLNQYATAIPEYKDIPKAVWAAIAVSALTHGGDQLDEARTRVLKEWQTLHDNGIVPQKPPNL